MARSWKIGRLFGIDLFIHWSFWLLPAFIYLNSLAFDGGAEAFMNLLLVFALFVCVLLHELGHALTARHYGIPTRDITLLPIGGVARLQRVSDRPWEEFWITLLGPAVNVAIAGLLAVVLVLADWSFAPVLATDPFLPNFIMRLFWMNVGLTIFNLLPAFPMDGGRILRAMLSLIMSRLRATKIAAGVGLLMALGFVYLGLFVVGNPMLVLLAVMVAVLGQKELAMVRAQSFEEMYHRPNPAMIRPTIIIMQPAAVIVEPTQPTDPNFTGVIWNPRTQMWIEWRDGQIVGTTPGWEGS